MLADFPAWTACFRSFHSISLGLWSEPWLSFSKTLHIFSYYILWFYWVSCSLAPWSTLSWVSVHRFDPLTSSRWICLYNSEFTTSEMMGTMHTFIQLCPPHTVDGNVCELIRSNNGTDRCLYVDELGRSVWGYQGHLSLLAEMQTESHGSRVLFVFIVTTWKTVQLRWISPILILDQCWWLLHCFRDNVQAMYTVLINTKTSEKQLREGYSGKCWILIL